MRRIRPFTALPGGLVLVAWLLAGCGGSNPATPDGQPLVYSGQLVQGNSVTHVLNLVREGTINLELTDLTPVLIQIPAVGELLLRIGVGIGVLDSSGNCQQTFGTPLAEGQSLNVLLTGKERCLLIFDNGYLPEEAVVDYTVTVTDVTQ